MLSVKKLLIKILEKCGIEWEQIEARTSYTAGTIGTRGAQVSFPWTHSDDYILAMTPVYIGDSSAYIVQPFYSNGNIYVNFYRASTSAQSSVVAHIRVVRIKKVGGTA
jgi:hypothetical protein